jgi:regulator of nonsense transcripts 2
VSKHSIAHLGILLTYFRLSELLYLPLPKLQTSAHKTDSIQIGANSGSAFGGDVDLDDIIRGGKWEDEEERRFFEDTIDLKDYVPKGILGLDDEDKDGQQDGESKEEREQKEKEFVEEEVRKLEEELAVLEVNDSAEGATSQARGSGKLDDEDETLQEEDGRVYAELSCPGERINQLS